MEKLLLAASARLMDLLPTCVILTLCLFAANWFYTAETYVPNEKLEEISTTLASGIGYLGVRMDISDEDRNKNYLTSQIAFNEADLNLLSVSLQNEPVDSEQARAIRARMHTTEREIARLEAELQKTVDQVNNLNNTLKSYTQFTVETR